MPTITADEFKNRTALFLGDTVVVDWTKDGITGIDTLTVATLKKLLG